MITNHKINRWTDAPLRLDTAAVFEIEPKEVFRALSDPDQMCLLFPWMHAVTLSPIQSESGAADLATRYLLQGETLIRRCHFGNGMVLEEAIVAWQPPDFYAYRGLDETHPFGMQGHVGQIRCTCVENRTALSWQHFFSHSNPAAMSAQIGANVEMALKKMIDLYGGWIERHEMIA